MAPDFSARAIEGFRANNFDEEIIDDIAQGLARAGLELRSPPITTQ